MVRPTLLYAVPTLYKRVHDGVINTMQGAGMVRQTLMRSALRLGMVKAECKNGGGKGLGVVDGMNYRFWSMRYCRRFGIGSEGI